MHVFHWQHVEAEKRAPRPQVMMLDSMWLDGHQQAKIDFVRHRSSRHTCVVEDWIEECGASGSSMMPKAGASGGGHCALHTPVDGSQGMIDATPERRRGVFGHDPHSSACAAPMRAPFATAFPAADVPLPVVVENPTLSGDNDVFKNLMMGSVEKQERARQPLKGQNSYRLGGSIDEDKAMRSSSSHDDDMLALLVQDASDLACGVAADANNCIGEDAVSEFVRGGRSMAAAATLSLMLRSPLTASSAAAADMLPQRSNSIWGVCMASAGPAPECRRSNGMGGASNADEEECSWTDSKQDGEFQRPPLPVSGSKRRFNSNSSEEEDAGDRTSDCTAGPASRPDSAREDVGTYISTSNSSKPAASGRGSSLLRRISDESGSVNTSRARSHRRRASEGAVSPMQSSPSSLWSPGSPMRNILSAHAANSRSAISNALKSTPLMASPLAGLAAAYREGRRAAGQGSSEPANHFRHLDENDDDDYDFLEQSSFDVPPPFSAHVAPSARGSARGSAQSDVATAPSASRVVEAAEEGSADSGMAPSANALATGTAQQQGSPWDAEFTRRIWSESLKGTFAVGRD